MLAITNSNSQSALLDASPSVGNVGSPEDGNCFAVLLQMIQTAESTESDKNIGVEPGQEDDKKKLVADAEGDPQELTQTQSNDQANVVPFLLLQVEPVSVAPAPCDSAEVQAL